MKRLSLVVPLAVSLVALAACGRVGELRPAPGQQLPVKPKLAATTPTPQELLTAPPYARPRRIDELDGVGERRQSDRFDLPPPEGGTAPQPQAQPSDDPSTSDPGSAPPQ